MSMSEKGLKKNYSNSTKDDDKSTNESKGFSSQSIE